MGVDVGRCVINEHSRNEHFFFGISFQFKIFSTTTTKKKQRKKIEIEIHCVCVCVGKCLFDVIFKMREEKKNDEQEKKQCRCGC